LSHAYSVDAVGVDVTSAIGSVTLIEVFASLIREFITFQVVELKGSVSVVVGPGILKRADVA